MKTFYTNFHIVADIRYPIATTTFYILVLLLIIYIRFYFHNNLDGTK